jgi:hypothetical protein
LFDRMLEARMSGAPPSEGPADWKAALGDWSSAESIEQQSRAAFESGLRWEAAYCDIYEALMRLCEHPEARETAQKVAGLIREVRLLQVADSGSRAAHL